MDIVGGVYREKCAYPAWDRLFGSGLRAAGAVSGLSNGSRLHTYAPVDWIDAVRSSAAAFGVSADVTPSEEEIEFSYFHPMSRAVLSPSHPKEMPPISVVGDAVLRFGLVEGTAVVRGRRVVFDPQTGSGVERFGANGSTAGELALVLNGWEAEQATGLPALEAGTELLKSHGAAVVITKLGPEGARVFIQGQETVTVPSYMSDRVFKIGSGDVFSAIFALHWAERGVEAPLAADLASRSVAHFVNGHRLPVPIPEEMEHGKAIHAKASPGRVYLAGPFFTLSQRWFIEETRNALFGLDLDVFSPLHDAGTGRPAVSLADADLRGLDGSAVVLALIDGHDPGTIFEVGHARKANIPVILVAERFDGYHRTMFEGTGCHIEDDYTTALYRTAWTAWSA
ncbi:PfkB family carbohydrate kinase [Rhizobium lentis]|uniref:PfkB family carbohydrate kinase n=1 Tax=Rhizobium lentis TaxID=1138194 RepID=UPI001C83093D|nr:PfkB family carbohydrate kinase [Rhizobium lentis]MBX5146676.1 nucleoside 2-deoxyribosyltransferase [Rhizobium lentis]